MKEIRVKKILDLRDCVWGFSNLVEKDLTNNLKKIIRSIPKEKYNQYSRGLKYTLSSNNPKLDDNLFKSEPIQKVISIFENQSIVEAIGNLLFESNTDIFQHIEYKNILSDITNKNDLIQEIRHNKMKLKQEDKEKMFKFLEILEEDDDVQNVFTNAV